ncbi:hypothetical protein Pmani_023836 [Petrolisthes manimaculis]|uniref:Uncharacterized protein n=1 Tax=Petrolisthes manimaculis TaxID=1843537 RepID=A0AAE1TZW4_9EUCA|nr:hypothetical protein Pmani_023836 [Petrolisthes manimaculis]
MKLVILACLATVALAAPQQLNPVPIQVISDQRVDQGDGNFQYEFETENGIYTNAVGAPGSQGQSNMQGSYRFTLDDGSVAEVTWTADENGYVAQSPLIPAMPEHVFELLRIAEQQRAEGIQFDQLGRRI